MSFKARTNADSVNPNVTGGHMDIGNKQQMESIVVFDKKKLDDLSANDALLLIGVCAAMERPDGDGAYEDDVKRIATLANKHPVFEQRTDDLDSSINKFVNMLKGIEDCNAPVAKAAKGLMPKLKETAFAWAAEILIPDGTLTKERKEILDKYALLLNIDDHIARKIPVRISGQK
jgi:hypothetical protein